MSSSRRLRLRSIFEEALLVVAAAAAASSVAACGGTAENAANANANAGGGDAGANTPTGDPNTQSLCSDNSGFEVPSAFPQGIHPAPVDYLEQRSETAFTMTDGQDAGAPQDGFTKASTPVSGSACSGATDRAACEAKLASIRVLPNDQASCLSQFPNRGGGFQSPGCSTDYLIYTRGDEVSRVLDTKAFLGPIDTKEEALWILRSQGIVPMCNSGDEPTSTIKSIEGDGFELRFQKNCEQAPTLFTYRVKADGTATETKRETFSLPPNRVTKCWSSGRRPAGFVPSSAESTAGADADADAVAIGEYFTSIAELEAASIIAFRRLHQQLVRHGAPADLLARLRRAARDEVRHTRTTRMLARRYGQEEPRRPHIVIDDAQQPADLAAIALENAREGCVRETFGALVAHYQATHAADAVVRDAMRVIAEEETQHAELSWDIADWLDTQLSPAARQAVHEERRQARRTLAMEAGQPVASSLERATGLPSPAIAGRLAATLEAMLADAA